MPTNSAEYMRAYRARRKADHVAYDANKPLIGQLKTRIGELEAEVIRLNHALVELPQLDRKTAMSLDKLIGYARRAEVVGVPEVDAAIERGEKGTPPTPFLKPALDEAMRRFRPVPKPGK